MYGAMAKERGSPVFIKIGEAAKMLGESVQTLHWWEKSGILKPAFKSDAGTRYYSKKQIEQMKRGNR